MKKMLLLLAGCMFCCCVFAQDIIIMKDGAEIKAQILEIGIDEIKYKKHGLESGPVYIEKKSAVFMIKYANGSKDVFGDNQKITAPVGQAKSTVSIKLLNRISSDDQTPISAETNEAIFDKDGKEIVPAGTRVEVIVDRQKSRSVGKPGAITIIVSSTTENDGSNLKLTGSYYAEGEDREVLAWVVTGVGCLLFILPGLIGLLIKGEPAIIPAGTVIPEIRIVP